MSKFAIDNIISLTLYDKDGNPIWVTDGDNMSMEAESESITIPEPQIGQHIYLEAYKSDGNKILVDGFYGGKV